MKTPTRFRNWLVPLLAAALALAQGLALAQYPPAPDQLPPAQARAAYSEAELDQMLAPIALYPDPLLSQILMAATYPLEVVEAARWSSAHPGLRGDDAVRAVEGEDWDPSVKSLVAFPEILQRMDQNLPWTQALGDAFLAQEPQVMQEIQVLRERAQAAGQLYSDSHLRVTDEAGVIAIEPANPGLIYVPYYDPLVVYGTWWWSSYPPVVWAPWPGYVAIQRPGVHVAFFWGTGIRVAVNFFFGAPDWHHRRVNVVNVNTFYYRPRVVHREARVYTRVTPGPWQHDPWHRRGIQYRSPELRREYAPQRQTSPVSPARRMQLEQQRQYERRQSGQQPYAPRRDGGTQPQTTPVSPARQMQLEQQRQYEQRRERSQQPSPAQKAQQQRYQQQYQEQYRQQYQRQHQQRNPQQDPQQRERGGETKPHPGRQTRDSGAPGKPTPRGRDQENDQRGPGGPGN